MTTGEAWITRDPIDPCAILSEPPGSADGASLLFLGTVRDNNEGREVGYLEYDAYPEMAEAVLREIVAEATERWSVGRIRVVHRVGRLEIGEVSVAIVLSTAHRGDAYAASRYVIEELKKRVPIWKREGYLDGSREWLPGTTPDPAVSER